MRSNEKHHFFSPFNWISAGRPILQQPWLARLLEQVSCVVRKGTRSFVLSAAWLADPVALCYFGGTYQAFCRVQDYQIQSQYFKVARFLSILSKEVQKSNFRQYGQMKQQRWSQRRERKKKEDAGARKGRKVAKRRVLQMFVFQEGRKVGSLKRQARRMRAQKLHAVLARSRFGSQKAKSTSPPEEFLSVGMSKKCTPLWL